MCFEYEVTKNLKEQATIAWYAAYQAIVKRKQVNIPYTMKY